MQSAFRNRKSTDVTLSTGLYTDVEAEERSNKYF